MRAQRMFESTLTVLVRFVSFVSVSSHRLIASPMDRRRRVDAPHWIGDTTQHSE